MTEAALAHGDKVVATLRKSEALEFESLQAKYPSDKLLVTKLDVTKPDEIESAFAKAKEAFGRVDVVFNNAGWGMIGEIESTTNDQARAMFEVRLLRRALIFLLIDYLARLYYLEPRTYRRPRSSTSERIHPSEETSSRSPPNLRS